ncbi:hypothetical protein A3G56_02590 [Candidatus Falkowbacteria bacterium RIFCSPLOWO2_12_FULL_45_10]|uniref:PsbP C-terminal domain-containing protein n=2 Tax=Candidatus Falkowiibacteriota TaxID=1752728 RepID=A0A1F5RN04_9BACT|nr:MAG: hypothetical protein A3D54_01210 [Candidatus Falkowbacteria bacterium RIFCSPHIGHO2_02_FULL_45_15]OGF19481.1 MAG: hypothetical protein A3G56_02590 [Candidatus Falkowbacteria bacterium RIFCSPLOWO2_12_FULL_45_10]
MKNLILSFSLLVFLLTGCSITDKQTKINNYQNNNEKPEQIIVSTSSKAETKNDFEMLSYVNNENSFSISYPKDWTAKEGKEFDYAFHIFFSKGSAQFGILPQGELDRGIPQVKPVEKKISIDNKQAIQKEWKLDNGNILIIINFLDYPKNWNKNNRFDITGQQKDIEMFDKMISSFKFVE